MNQPVIFFFFFFSPCNPKHPSQFVPLPPLTKFAVIAHLKTQPPSRFLPVEDTGTGLHVIAFEFVPPFSLPSKSFNVTGGSLRHSHLFSSWCLDLCSSLLHFLFDTPTTFNLLLFHFSIERNKHILKYPIRHNSLFRGTPLRSPYTTT